jgi:hypothetical protein
VVTVQTAAQATEVRTLMRQAGISPQAAVVDPCSAVLRSIARPPARRTGPAAGLGRPVPVGGQATGRGTLATGRGAVAMSGAYRGRRGRRG